MWVFTQYGFLSAVARPTAPDQLSIRGRDKLSLYSLIAFAEDVDRQSEVTDIIEGAGTDYPFRVYASRSLLTEYLAAELSDLEYTNFKSQVMKTRGVEVERVFLRVWSALFSLTPRGVKPTSWMRSEDDRYRNAGRGHKRKTHWHDFIPKDDEPRLSDLTGSAGDRDFPHHLESGDEAWADYRDRQRPKSIHDMSDDEVAALDGGGL